MAGRNPVQSGSSCCSRAGSTWSHHSSSQEVERWTQVLVCLLHFIKPGILFHGWCVPHGSVQKQTRRYISQGGGALYQVQLTKINYHQPFIHFSNIWESSIGFGVTHRLLLHWAHVSGGQGHVWRAAFELTPKNHGIIQREELYWWRDASQVFNLFLWHLWG